MNRGDRVSHASPLFMIEWFGPESHASDVLHNWDLGCLGAYIALSLFNLMDSKFFCPDVPFLLIDDIRNLAILRLKGYLKQYYKEKRQEAQWKKTGSEVGFV
jgi:hypothetical protein